MDLARLVPHLEKVWLVARDTPDVLNSDVVPAGRCLADGKRLVQTRPLLRDCVEGFGHADIIGAVEVEVVIGAGRDLGQVDLDVRRLGGDKEEKVLGVPREREITLQLGAAGEGTEGEGNGVVRFVQGSGAAGQPSANQGYKAGEGAPPVDHESLERINDEPLGGQETSGSQDLIANAGAGQPVAALI